MSNVKICLQFQLVVKWHVAIPSTFDLICRHKLAHHLCLHKYKINSYMTPPSKMKWPKMVDCCVILAISCETVVSFNHHICTSDRKSLWKKPYNKDAKLYLVSKLTVISTNWTGKITMHKHNTPLMVSSVQLIIVTYPIWRCMLGCTDDQTISLFIWPHDT
jgi:hypothetical protein